ncbi:hypothetical protein BDP55DRAFT_398656 [Colletotrichum godetiae]|uniref:Secreted protein n=1 Tax=Colletotrichum godetiae TaxID=1209918 RepID=A0AAJ0EM86_9PEZI|nr:uncharacterized protein BDP55DRAFT_398656 [Colletotrichum godetiae]KAK1658410.1 hypothetical protein BDP55DRAFT_398656 [Colletotrichum godetiae]
MPNSFQRVKVLIRLSLVNVTASACWRPRWAPHHQPHSPLTSSTCKLTMRTQDTCLLIASHKSRESRTGACSVQGARGKPQTVLRLKYAARLLVVAPGAIRKVIICRPSSIFSYSPSNVKPRTNFCARLLQCQLLVNFPIQLNSNYKVIRWHLAAGLGIRLLLKTARSGSWRRQKLR